MNMTHRLDKLRALMSAHHLDILALIPGANLRYLTGGVHYVMERPILWFLPVDGQPIALIPRLEVPLFSRDPIAAALYPWTDKDGYESAFKSVFDALHVVGKTIGVEGLRMRFFEGELIRKYAPDSHVVAADDVLAQLRLIKDADEIAAMRQAIAISEQALTQTLSAARPGMTERELADQLESHLKALGADGLAFATILHGGGNTALPHMGPLADSLPPNAPLLIDFGATYQGYCADITRTVFLGKPSAAFHDFYNVVKEANAAGRAAAMPGVTAGSVDRAAQAILVDAGYEQLIRHRTGHGLGLEAHEQPYIIDGNEQLLEPGMVFTVEPGIYELGVIGVRIEDDVLITPDGSESLTTFTRNIQVY